MVGKERRRAACEVLKQAARKGKGGWSPGPGGLRPGQAEPCNDRQVVGAGPAGGNEPDLRPGQVAQ
ncbi:hypothetical protein GCM10010156_49520 [Planobispora rosea]|uniref:Uncharacterized protein n=1 Tax=Planobispora rosea TaxID=35762 RepID=A0A8J3WEP5_PLARO|nr:hypothetical protein GCM10010156_49520 [Planobispora rosea]GIH86463.1 hypothetical protein Pro02_48710 [Planobispora rosea]